MYRLGFVNQVSASLDGVLRIMNRQPCVCHSVPLKALFETFNEMAKKHQLFVL